MTARRLATDAEAEGSLIVNGERFSIKAVEVKIDRLFDNVVMPDRITKMAVDVTFLDVFDNAEVERLFKEAKKK